MGRPKRTQRFKITRFTNPSGKVAWRVSGTLLTGGRVRENHATKADALERMSALEHENAPELGAAAPSLQRTVLTTQQIADAESALAILPHGTLAAVATNVRRWEKLCADLGLSIDDALSFCVSRYHPDLKEMTILQARDLFLASRRNVRPKTRQHYESATRRLLKADRRSRTAVIRPSAPFRSSPPVKAFASASATAT